MSEGDYTFLPEATDTVRIKVVPKSGNRLMGLSLSGYAAGGYQIQADLVEEPVQVLAADYGKTENKKVVLSWKDGREEDTTADHVTAFEIYKTAWRQQQSLRQNGQIQNIWKMPAMGSEPLRPTLQEALQRERAEQ
ncbi:MAG: hypothetical protein ACLTSZ_10250 [Lachnospiraceae bacterium]